MLLPFLVVGEAEDRHKKSISKAIKLLIIFGIELVLLVDGWRVLSAAHYRSTDAVVHRLMVSKQYEYQQG